MLDKPDLPDEKLIATLYDDYGLHITRLTFLPLGADRYAAVYRAVANDGTPYFVKLKRANFDEVTVALPRLLRDQGVTNVIAPLVTGAGTLWTTIQDFTLIVYPFIDGRNGFEANLSAEQWRDLGSAFRKIHAAQVPPALSKHIRRETYSPRWRDMTRAYLARAGRIAGADPISQELAAFLKSKRDQTLDLVERSARLASDLLQRPRQFVLCHSDIHAGNVLIDAGGALYIVDWDEPIFAPKERDLMFPGGAQFANKRTPAEEETLFYRGYGQTQVDAVALAYYRYERIVVDLAEYSLQVFEGNDSDATRQQAIHRVATNFLPGNTIEAAYASDVPTG